MPIITDSITTPDGTCRPSWPSRTGRPWPGIVMYPDAGGVRPTLHAMAARLAARAGRVPERVAAAMSFHGGGLADDDPGSPHLLAGLMGAAVYVGAAQNDPSCTPEQSATLEAALTAAGVDHVIDVVPRRARVRRHGQRSVRPAGLRTALAGDGNLLLPPPCRGQPRLMNRLNR